MNNIHRFPPPRRKADALVIRIPASVNVARFVQALARGGFVLKSTTNGRLEIEDATTRITT